MIKAQIFYQQLVAAGLGNLPITWADDGTITGRDNLTDAQAAALDEVIAAHDPAAAAVMLAWESLRAERDRRLTNSDVQVVADRWEAMTNAEQTAWAAFRQALRDLPEVTADPTNPVWPVNPVAEENKS